MLTSTTYKVVLPFYGYAAIAFLVGTVLVFISTPAFEGHYFQPEILAITHVMALGWGTMMILGASHQLIPVITETPLYSNTLAYGSFISAALGIPLLVYGFYLFDMGWPATWGGGMVVFSIALYVINLAGTINRSTTENVHTVFVITAALWLLSTTILGFTLVINFVHPLFSKDSLAFLPLHAHLGIIGWFLLLVMGVGSRLIPMFLLSKYTNTQLLWLVYILINGALLVFIGFFFLLPETSFYIIPVSALIAAVILFGYYCYQCYTNRLRRQVDDSMKMSISSVALMLLPVVLLFAGVIRSLFFDSSTKMILVYGFLIFFGWITAIILGMTFKTLPFIVWNKVYHKVAGLAKTPNPKDLVIDKLLKVMNITYILGFAIFIPGVWFGIPLLLKFGAAYLVATAILYNWNVVRILFHKASNP